MALKVTKIRFEQSSDEDIQSNNCSRKLSLSSFSMLFCNTCFLKQLSNTQFMPLKARGKNLYKQYLTILCYLSFWFMFRMQHLENKNMLVCTLLREEL